MSICQTATRPSRATAEARWFTTRRVRVVAPSRGPRSLTLDHGFPAVFKPCQSGGWVVSLPTLPHARAHGPTLAAARTRARALIRAHLVALGRPRLAAA